MSNTAREAGKESFVEMVVRAFPVIPGKEDEIRAFAAELQGPRSIEISELYGRYGVARESWHVQTTPFGTWVIAVTALHDPEVEQTAQTYSESEHPFDRWFKNRVFALTGINPDEQPLGPPTTCVFDTDQIPSTLR